MTRNRLTKLSIIITLVFVATTLANFIKASASTTYQIDSNMNLIMDKVADIQASRTKEAFSSNPYDYIKNNENYNNIVALGPEALEVIDTKIKNSSENGLKEYILAIAAEEIAKVNLKGETSNWSNGKEWSLEWERHLRNIPDDVERITSSKEIDIENKKEALIKLGVPAVPFILEKIESGKAEFAPTVVEILKGNPNTQIEANVTDYVKWAKENKGKFIYLKELVNKEIQ